MIWLSQTDGCRQLPYNQSVRMRQGKHVRQTFSSRQRGDKGISTAAVVIIHSSWQLKGSKLLELRLLGLISSTDQCFRRHYKRLNIHLHYNCNCYRSRCDISDTDFLACAQMDLALPPLISLMWTLSHSQALKSQRWWTRWAKSQIQ